MYICETVSFQKDCKLDYEVSIAYFMILDLMRLIADSADKFVFSCPQRNLPIQHTPNDPNVYAPISNYLLWWEDTN